MKKSKTIPIIIFLVAAAAVFYFAYGVVKDRYFVVKNGAETEIQGETFPSGTENQTGVSGNGQESSSGEGDDIGNGTRHEISSADCEMNCAEHKDNSENFRYCQEVCGQRRIAPKNSEEECASLSGLEKDYCFRDLAVTKKDAVICGKIADGRIKTVCKNRVAEEILN